VGLGELPLFVGRAKQQRRSALTRCPPVFGYHEIFHLIVIVAAALQ
jgi:predicted membrane channel-forming protein YqfA (hemolysin III family)